jgi:serine/threonine-protein phosphatase 2B catalytic subunit
VRGCSYYFSASALFGFLERNKLLCVVRAHEYEDDGFMFHYTSDDYSALDKRADRSVPPLVTVFSAANYCDTNRNKVYTFNSTCAHGKLSSEISC